MSKRTKSPSLRGAPSVKDLDAALDAFAAGAEQPREVGGSTRYPWEDPRVREDVSRQILVRLPEPLYLKLRYIADNTPASMNSFIRDVIAPAIEKEIARMTRMG